MAASSRHVKTETTGRWLSFGEVKEFVAAMDAAGATNSTPIKARTRWRGRLVKLEAHAIRFGDRLTPGQKDK